VVLLEKPVVVCVDADAPLKRGYPLIAADVEIGF
jgi:hypothetical protein